MSQAVVVKLETKRVARPARTKPSITQLARLQTFVHRTSNRRDTRGAVLFITRVQLTRSA